jgi:hypothetical protein
MKVVRLSALLTGRLYTPQGRFLVLISVTGRVNTRLLVFRLAWNGYLFQFLPLRPNVPTQAKIRVRRDSDIRRATTSKDLTSTWSCLRQNSVDTTTDRPLSSSEM